jgi:curli biogenesis system outer membrane secretion channel CsgG
MTKLKGLLAAASLTTLTACISPVAGSDGRYTAPIGNSPVISNETPYSAALRCVGAANARPVRIAVGQIADYTGKEEFEGGKRVTQGAALMAMSAFAKAGVRLVERFDTGVAELELKYANNRLIGAGGAGVKPIVAGSVPGSDYYLVGGITELNYNIRSVGADAFGSDPATQGAKGSLGYKAYVMNVALDLRLVNTTTLEVVDTISYQKQIIGREVSAGIFDFLNGTIIDVGVGERALEPIQLAVRAVIERGVLEMVSTLTGIGPEACAGAFGPDGDPLGQDRRAPIPQNVPAPDKAVTAAVQDNEDRYQAARAKPYRWHGPADAQSSAGKSSGLRGSKEE